MPASLLYHTNQIENVQVKTVDYWSNQVIFNVLFIPEKPLCPCCCYDKSSSKGLKKCNAVGLRVIKGMRFLLLSNYEKLNPKKQSSLECLLEVNKPIALAHAMKEQIRLFWSKGSVQEGAKFLGWWIIDAIESGIHELQKTGRTLLRHWKGLVNYFKHPKSL